VSNDQEPSKLCDLHIHSTFSDSDETVEDIVEKACQKKLFCISLTDHDTVDGLTLARDCCQRNNIEFIEGIEITAEHKDIEIHVLGYFIDPKNNALQKELAKIRVLRTERLLAIAQKLNDIGVSVDKDELLALIGESLPTRLHLGMYLVDKGIAKNLRQVFRKYLSQDSQAYVPRLKYSAKEAIDVIHNAGGFACLAHPQLVRDQSLIEEFVRYGLDGIEVVYPGFSKNTILFYETMANKLGLFKVGGSDAHGSYKTHTSVGEVSVPYEWADKMHKAWLKSKK
jgi:predicted metal-dependent phosphoesterase TrpH